LNDEGQLNANQLPSDKDNVPSQFCDIGAARVHNAENPTTKAMLVSPERPWWVEALCNEVHGNFLKPDNPSMVAVDWASIPKDALITYLTFVNKRKIKPGREDRYKCRGCLRGDLCEQGLVETYAPTVSSLTCSCLQQVAIIDEMEQALVDTVGAFLSQDYPDALPALYVKLPKEVAEVCGLDPRQVYRIVKYLYGIPDAGRAYYKAYRDLLLSRGYTQSSLDPCLFISRKGTDVVYAWIHVDDTWELSLNVNA
jgi:hypothetical protein